MWTSHRIELEKSDVQLFCRADGDPAPTVTWLDRNGLAVNNNTKQYEVGLGFSPFLGQPQFPCLRLGNDRKLC